MTFTSDVCFSVIIVILIVTMMMIMIMVIVEHKHCCLPEQETHRLQASMTVFDDHSHDHNSARYT